MGQKRDYSHVTPGYVVLHPLYPNYHGPGEVKEVEILPQRSGIRALVTFQSGLNVWLLGHEILSAERRDRERQVRFDREMRRLLAKKSPTKQEKVQNG